MRKVWILLGRAAGILLLLYGIYSVCMFWLNRTIFDIYPPYWDVFIGFNLLYVAAISGGMALLYTSRHRLGRTRAEWYDIEQLPKRLSLEAEPIRWPQLTAYLYLGIGGFTLGAAVLYDFAIWVSLVGVGGSMAAIFMRFPSFSGIEQLLNPGHWIAVISCIAGYSCFQQGKEMRQRQASS